MIEEQSLISIGDFIRQLSMFDKEQKLYFSGLDFFRLQQRGPYLVQIEFDQTVYRNDQGRVVIENDEYSPRRKLQRPVA